MKKRLTRLQRWRPRTADRALEHRRRRSPTATKIMVALVAILAAPALTRWLAKDRFFSVLLVMVLLAGIFDSVWEQRTFIGLRQVSVTIQRSTSPVAYWIVLGCYLALAAAVTCSLFFESTGEALKRLLG